MESQVVRVAVIVGSVRKERFGPTVADWFIHHARARTELAVDKIDLVDYPVKQSREPSPVLKKLQARLGVVDAFVVVTPEYNHSFPGHLKTVIDSIGNEWKSKPVGFVSYGGMSGGLRAVEQLRVVFAELHSLTVRETVSFHAARSQFLNGGVPADPSRVGAAADRLLDQLSWWARASRNQRNVEDYPG